MRYNIWEYGYDVDGNEKKQLGKFYGSVKKKYKNYVKSLFVNENGNMFNIEIVSFKNNENKEIK